jgi:hypothetical protein
MENSSEEGRPSRPNIQYLRGENLSREELFGKRSTSSTTSTPDESRRLTEEEARQAQRLMDEGMSAKFARAAVLGKEDT